MPNSRNVRIKPKRAARQPKGPHITAATPPGPGITCARSACFCHARTITGGSRAARRLAIATMQDLAHGLSHTAGSTWWFLASCRGLREDLERSAGSSSTSSPIVMVAPALARRDHLALIAHCSLIGDHPHASWSLVLCGRAGSSRSSCKSVW